jgi:hypothetical protein
VISITNYEVKQVKVSVDAQVAKAFKNACLTADVSMSTILSQYMAKYSKFSNANIIERPMATKRQRRDAIEKIILQLERVRNAEEIYQDRIPDNLRSSARFDSADAWVATLDQAIDLLGSLP